MDIYIRPATLDDVPAIAKLIAANARKGGLLPRTEASIRATIDNFVVAMMQTEDGGRKAEISVPSLPSSIVVGCGTLFPHNTALVELRSLAVDETIRGGGIGKKLVAALVNRARERHFGEIFALTRAMDFFIKCGFAITAKEEFPEKVWRDCVGCPMLANCDEVAVTMDLAVEDGRRKTEDGTPKTMDDGRQTMTAPAPNPQPPTAATQQPIRKVVLAYSGGLDTSCALPWLKETYGCEVICFIANIGQNEEPEAVRDRALASGADKVIIRDLREEFANGYLFPLIQSGAIYEKKYLLGAAIARPIIAKHQVQIAEEEGADALAHGSTGKGNDQVRFELSYFALNPELTVIAPWRLWHIKGRDDALEYAHAHGIPITETREDIYSDDDNLWHISHEGGRLEDPWDAPDERMFQLVVAPEKAPDQAQEIEIEFVNGVPRKLNGQEMRGHELIRTLNLLGATHGVGRADLVENRLVGMKSHGVYETPGGTILREAHQGLEELTLDREMANFKQMVALRYADLVYNGKWFTPLRDALQAFVAVTQRDVTGTSRVRLYKGNATLVGRKATYSLYREDLATFMDDEVYDQTDGEGFIALYGLPLRIKAAADRQRIARALPKDVRKVEGRD
ncbi:MAG TPA: argininosuccinate synthase [Thermoflexales bacterium]|nr:argininosuccinate synthase [Thermoflexales bacterium]